MGQRQADLEPAVTPVVCLGRRRRAAHPAAIGRLAIHVCSSNAARARARLHSEIAGWSADATIVRFTPRSAPQAVVRWMSRLRWMRTLDAVVAWLCLWSGISSLFSFRSRKAAFILGLEAQEVDESVVSFSSRIFSRQSGGTVLLTSPSAHAGPRAAYVPTLNYFSPHQNQTSSPEACRRSGSRSHIRRVRATGVA